jgi:hypothetical protein
MELTKKTKASIQIGTVVILIAAIVALAVVIAT